MLLFPLNSYINIKSSCKTHFHIKNELKWETKTIKILSKYIISKKFFQFMHNSVQTIGYQNVNSIKFCKYHLVPPSK